ncbi:GNAT family N-acetyltransferase [Saccharopolyspora rosea]|uniref:GNAT family N-acetyltransferase n=1 Tax=Saccharopolyspora rosea TaxID=524884 RepID=A0ABW3FU24_9PSEU|nr:GNAT family N-acetyltransferase [Saccharopolyspora rosea]
MADAAVRAAVPSDAPEIARIQTTTWRTAYAEVLPRTALDRLDDAEIERAWRSTLTEGPATVLVATEGEWLVGFCAGGPAPDAEAAAANGRAPADAATLALVSSLLVEPRWGRRGHGGRLLAALARQLADSGSTRGIVWVPESDTASMSFFRGVGWNPDGTVRTLDAGGTLVRELRLTGSLELRTESK